MYHFTIQSAHLYCSGSPITKAFWRDAPHQLGSGGNLIYDRPVGKIFAGY